MTDKIPCPDCGALFAPSDGAMHAYLGASAGCWAAYGEILAREYSDMAYMRGHQYTVDAYAVQHPGQPERRAIQSVATHLISLYGLFVLERSPADLVQIRQKVANASVDYHWLTPPDDVGALTVLDVLAAPDAAAHNALVERWARQMWEIWQPHHAQIIAWADEIGVT